MSQHPSLSSGAKSKQHRSVLKRFERIKILLEKYKWKEGDSVFGLAKVKTLKFKIKKEKMAGAEEAAAPPGAEGVAAATQTANEAAPEKGKAKPDKGKGKERESK